MRRKQLIPRALSAAVLAMAMFATASPAGTSAATPVNWPAYLLRPGHPSANTAATAITPANVSSLHAAWTWTPAAPAAPPAPRPAGLLASPTVFDGRVYIGANNGAFYALNEAAGVPRVAWWRDFGVTKIYPTSPCKQQRGIVSTDTVAADPATSEPTVYVAPADGYLYALRASDGAEQWRSLVVAPGTKSNQGYNWSSPTVSHGRVYIGMSSNCDHPLIRGGLKSFDQHTGALLGTYFDVPAGAVGGSIWSSAAASADGQDVFVTTGNPDESGPPYDPPGDSYSVVRLNATTLAVEDKFTVAGLFLTDFDFGSSPTLFNSSKTNPTPLVGACNKNGVYYVLRQQDLAAGPVWSRAVGNHAGADAGADFCISSAINDTQRSHLIIAANSTTIGGVKYLGSVRALNAADGTVVWQHGLPCVVLGSPSMNGRGVVAVGLYNNGRASSNACKSGTSPALYLFDASNGKQLRTLPAGVGVYSQPVFADNYLLVATEDGTLLAYTP